MLKKSLIVVPLILGTAFLTGCGDNYPSQASIQLDERVESALTASQIGLTTSSALYFKEDAIAKAKVHMLEADAVTDYLNSSDAQSFSTTLSYSGEEAKQLQSMLDNFDKQKNQVESSWVSHIKLQKLLIEKDVSAAKAEDEKWQKKLNDYNVVTKKETFALVTLDEELKQNKAEFEGLKEAVVEAMNHDIVDNELPIRKLRNSSFDFQVHSTNYNLSCGEKNGRYTVDRKKVDGRCYYINIPDNKLRAYDGVKVIDKNLSLALKLRARKGELKKESRLAEKALRKANIIAENKFNTNGQKLTRTADQSAKRLKILRVKLAAVTDPSERSKELFVKKTLNENRDFAMSAARRYFEASALNIIDSAYATKAMPLLKAFELESGASFVVTYAELLIGKVGRHKGAPMFIATAKSLMGDFDKAKQVAIDMVNPVHENTKAEAFAKLIPFIAEIKKSPSKS